MPSSEMDAKRRRLRALSFSALGLALASCSDDPGSSQLAPSAAESTSAPAAGVSGARSSASVGSAGTSGQRATVNAAERPRAGDGARPSVANGGGGGTAAPAAGGAGAVSTAAAGTTAASGTGAGANGAAGASGTDGATGTAGSSAEPQPSCEKGAVKASEVVFVGDSFIAQSGAIPRMTSELARKAGTIGMSESYRSSAVSGTQLTTGDIPNQFERAQSESPVKVVLMDGGGNDLLFGTNRCMGSFDAGCKEVVDVVNEMFTQFKAAGAKEAVYFFYPEPMGIGAQIKDGMDILRPEMKKLCDETALIRCIWVDQRETWEGNYDEFTSDGIHPTDAGSMASAQQIWDAMVANCVAQ